MEINEFKEEDYLTVFGVKKTFEKMLDIVDKSYKEDHQKGGRKDGATPRERLEITLKYLRQYVSQRYLAKEYGVGKSRIAPIVKWTSKVLVKDRRKCTP